MQGKQIHSTSSTRSPHGGRGLHLARATRVMAACFLLAACAAPRSVPAGPPPAAAPAPDGLPPVHIKTAKYELYAPSDAVAQALRPELDRAASTFERYFGAAPPPIGVVVFSSPAETRMLDLGPLRTRVRGILPWIVQHESDPTVSRSGVEGHRALAHEACHVYLVARTGVVLDRPVRSPAGPAPSYGDPSLPDWFDEGVATLCEPAATHATRVAAIRAAGDSAIALAELFRMEHPALRQIQSMVAAQRAAGDSAAAGRAGVISVRVPADAGASATPSIFYAQANSVLEFMADREGPQFVGRLGEGLARGLSVEQVLAAHARRLPRDLPGLEREWKQWVAAR